MENSIVQFFDKIKERRANQSSKREWIKRNKIHKQIDELETDNKYLSKVIDDNVFVEGYEKSLKLNRKLTRELRINQNKLDRLDKKLYNLDKYYI